jgi:predicted phosphoribosyltransferase
MLETVPRLADRVGVFADRQDAGEVLAQVLADLRGTNALVVAIPSGGVPVAAALARSLGLPLAVAPVSKVLFPWTTEAGFGAVAFDGTVWIDEALRARHRLTELQVEKATDEAKAKVARRTGAYPPLQLERRVPVPVDDGIAGGSTMRTAVAALRRAGARSLIIAVPTAHEAAVELFEPLVDRLVVANVRGGREFAVASAYRHWDDVSEAEAAALIAAGKPERGGRDHPGVS